MRKISFLLTMLYLLGCSGFSSDEDQLWEIRLMAGNSLYSKQKPKSDPDYNNYYRFNDVNGQEYRIPPDSVLSIEPVKVKK